MHIKGEYKLRERNTSKKYCNGSVWQSIRGGEFTIIGQIDEMRVSKQEYDRFLVEFYNGYITSALSTAIRVGSVANPLHRTIFGVGYLGSKCRTVGTHKKEYDLWNSILCRCYSPYNLKKSPTYKGCIVDERWHNFQNFCDDKPHLEGYKEWKENTHAYRWALDKDIKIQGNKIYSKDTCIFVTITENNKEFIKRTQCNLTGKTYKAVRISDGYEEIFYNQTEFGRKYGLSQEAVCRYIKKNQTKYGWKFSTV